MDETFEYNDTVAAVAVPNIVDPSQNIESNRDSGLTTSSVTGALDDNQKSLRPVSRPQTAVEPAISKPASQSQETTPVDKSYPERTWTSSDNRQVKARLVSRDRKSVILSVRGKLYRVPLARLSRKDTDYLKAIIDPALR